VTNSNDALIAILKDQIEIEQQAIDSIRDAADVSKNTTWKLVLSAILMDSTKHREICQALIDVISGKVIHLIDKVRMERVAKRHLDLEGDALRNIRKAVQNAEDATVKALLEFIEADERKHHTALDALLTRIQTPEELDFQAEMADLTRTFY
jgi:rubrerythrin